MWGEGGRYYWGRRGAEEGIVVVFAWPSSEERHLKPYVDLYASLGWSSLICHSDFLTLFFPGKAMSLAGGLLNELVKEVKSRQLPIVFAAFSGGAKGCMYKVLQLIEGKCEGEFSLDEYQLVRDCLCGQIYDSSPVDFTSDLGTRFVLHPTVGKTSQPTRVVSWMAKAFASGLDTLFISRFEAQRAEYWQALYSSVSLGPFLVFCAEDDELAPFPVVYNFAQRLQDLGGDVRLVKWHSSPHVDHYKQHATEYKAAVVELLGKAAIIYSQRRQPVGASDSCSKIPQSVCNLHEAAVNSNESLRRVAVTPSDHFFLPSSMDIHETQEEPKAESFKMQNPAGINPHGVLGQILYEACVPKNVEGWDIKPVKALNVRQIFSARRHGPFNPIKCIRRSRL